MSQYVDTPVRHFTPSAAIAAHARVVQASDGKISTAGVSDLSIGVAEVDVFTTGTDPLMPIGVRLNTAQGTRKMIAAGTIAKGGVCYGAALGKVSATPSGSVEGICLDGAASGDICEVMYLSDASGATAGVDGVAAGYKIARGVATTASASDTVVSGLTTVVAVVACLSSDPVAGCATATATIGDQAGTPAAGSFLLKTWMPTDTTHPVLIAATTFSKAVNWIAIGT